MTIEELTEILTRGENITTEYKECADYLGKSVYETVCSFSNRYGGHIVLGVSDNGTVIGVNRERVHQIKKDFINTLNNSEKISPSLNLELQDFIIDERMVLYVYIPIASQLVMCSGRIYDRAGDADVDVTKMTDRVADLAARKSREYTERMLFPYAKESDFRFDLMKRVRLMAETRNEGHPWLNMNDMEIMKSAGLYEDNLATGTKGFNLAAILLFGKDEVIQSAASGYVTDCIFRVENLDRFDDRLLVRTNLIDSRDRILEFIQKHTNDKFYSEGTRRISIRDVIAREIVGNSLSHREYSSAIPARIIIEKDHIYADNWSRSQTFGKVDPQRYTPNPKNPLICRFFENIGFADTLGSGVRNLYKYTKIYSNGAEPEIIEGDKFETIVPLTIAAAANDIYADKILSDNLSNKVSEPYILSDNLSDEVSEPYILSDNLSDEVSEPYILSDYLPNKVQGPCTLPSYLSGKLSMKEKNIMSLLVENPEYTASELAKTLGVTRQTINNRIKLLKDKKIIQRVGSSKKGYWKISR